MTADLSADSKAGKVRSSPTAHGGPSQGRRRLACGETDRDVHVVVGRVRWGWLAKVFDNRSFDVPGEGSLYWMWLKRMARALPGSAVGPARPRARAVHWRGELLLDSLAATSTRATCSARCADRARLGDRRRRAHADPSTGMRFT
jgi:hypothetical protein